MADVELVIKIPETEYDWIKQALKGYTSYPCTLRLYDAVKNGTPLPKRHDRLIEASSVNQIVRPIEASDVKWGMTAETAIRLIHDAFDRAPTIIEADKESKDVDDIE